MWIVAIAIQACAALWLGRCCGLMTGLAIYAAAAMALTGLAGILLRSATVDTVNWKNRVAGLLLPWSALLGGGRLTELLIKNGVASLVFGFVMVLGDRWGLFEVLLGPDTAATSEMGWGGWVVQWLTIGCWLAMLIAWFWIWRSMFRHQLDVVSVLLRGRHSWIPLFVPPTALGISIALRAFGYTWWALLAVGLPLLIMFLPLLLMLTVIFIHQLLGKPIRWN